jgi:hypothetical protein
VIASRSAAEPSRGVPLADLLARFPAHKYQFLGKTVAEDDIVDTGTLSHAFPAGLSLHLPVSVGVNNALIISWDKVTGPPDGGFRCPNPHRRIRGHRGRVSGHRPGHDDERDGENSWNHSAQGHTRSRCWRSRPVGTSRSRRVLHEAVGSMTMAPSWNSASAPRDATSTERPIATSADPAQPSTPSATAIAAGSRRCDPATGRLANLPRGLQGSRRPARPRLRPRAREQRRRRAIFDGAGDT